MKHYTIYLPSHTHDDMEIGTIEYTKTTNSAVLKLHNQAERFFYSPFAAMAEVQKKHPSAYLAED